MLDITESINLIRYLIVLRPRHTLVKVPECFASDLSTVLGRTIAAQLPTREAHEWERTRQLWEAHFLHRNQGKGAKLIEESPLITIPPAPWPVETVFFPYPVKQDYGQDEPILWELKLLGEAADHGFFLERILSALETISTQPPMNMQLESKGLWGRYQIHAIYAARGPTWEPFVEAGELNLDYFPTPGQWREGLELGAREDYTRPRRLLVWLSPFDLGPEPYVYPKHGRRKRNIAKRNLPTIEGIIRALMARVAGSCPARTSPPRTPGRWSRGGSRGTLGRAEHPPTASPSSKRADRAAAERLYGALDWHAEIHHADPRGIAPLSGVGVDPARGPSHALWLRDVYPALTLAQIATVKSTRPTLSKESALFFCTCS